MAITFVSAASAEADTVAMPSHQAGDLIVVLAMRSTNSAITVPSGWFSEVIASGNGYVAMAWKTAASGAETTGTWTSAESIAIVIYRSNASKYVLAGGRLTTTQNTTSIQYFAFSVANVAYRLGPGNSRYIGFCWTNGAGAAATPPTGMVNRTNAGTTYRIAAHDTNSEIASWAFQSVATTAMVWRVLLWEIFESDISVGGASFPPIGPGGLVY